MLPLLEVFKKDLYHCADCNYCVDAVWPERGIAHVCPTLQSHSPLTSYSGRGYIAAARAWLEGATLDLAVLGERVFTCTTCSHCETVCPIGLRPTQVGRALRGELWARDEVPAPLRALHEAMQRDGNPNEVARAARNDWQPVLPQTAQLAQVLYLPGCAAATALPSEAQATVALLQAAGFAVVTLGEQDTCCGAPWFELGLHAEAEFMREALASKTAICSEIVISGLECACSWQRRGTGQVPRSFTEWCVAQVRAGGLRLGRREHTPREIHLLDSCQTRQTVGPAQDLRTLCELLDLGVAPSTSSARHVVCCGAAGGMPQMAPESAVRMANARLNDQQAAMAIFVSADPRCVAHVRRAAPTAAIFGVAEFLHRYFEVVA